MSLNTTIYIALLQYYKLVTEHVSIGMLRAYLVSDFIKENMVFSVIGTRINTGL